MKTDFEELAAFNLRQGSHMSPDEGLCAMEAVAWLEGLEHTDRPACTCPVIARYVQLANDHLYSDDRQRLVPYLPRLVGTNSPAHQQERLRYLCRVSVTVFLPLFLDYYDRSDLAEKFRSLDRNQLHRALPLITANLSRKTGRQRKVSCALGSAYRIVLTTLDTDAVYISDFESLDLIVMSHLHFTREQWADTVLETLDGLLSIGPEPAGFSTNVPERIARYRELVG